MNASSFTVRFDPVRVGSIKEQLFQSKKKCLLTSGCTNREFMVPLCFFRGLISCPSFGDTNFCLT